MPMQIVFDTDIGTCVDDLLALAVILGSPEIQLAGVTCVYGDVGLRARMVRKLLELHGSRGVPILRGASEPLLALHPIYWEGHEGDGLVGPEDDTPEATEDAVSFIVRTVRDNPGKIHLLALGPLTNVALAMKRDPRVARDLGGLMIMGGVLRGPEQLDRPYVEHNIRCDPEAAHLVFTSGAAITLVPLDVTTRVRLTTAGVARIAAAGTPFHAAVADQVRRDPRFVQDGATFLHDPLAAALLIAPDLVGYETVHVDVELGGRLTTGATLMRAATAEALANARVALTVDVERTERFVLDRIVP